MLNLLATIENPALKGTAAESIATPAQAGSALAIYIGALWQTLVILGGLALLINMLMGGFAWVNAGGEKGKLEEAKQRIFQSITGFAVLVSVAAISIFLSTAFGINLLKPQFPNLLNGASTNKSTHTTPSEINQRKVPNIKN